MYLQMYLQSLGGLVLAFTGESNSDSGIGCVDVSLNPGLNFGLDPERAGATELDLARELPVGDHIVDVRPRDGDTFQHVSDFQKLPHDHQYPLPCAFPQKVAPVVIGEGTLVLEPLQHRASDFLRT